MRLLLYALVFVFGLVLLVLELKTGIPLGDDRRHRAYEDPRSWDEVWTQLLELDRLALYLAVVLVGVAATELWMRFGKEDDDEEEDRSR